MGRLIYHQDQQSFDIDDRVLAHLRVVVMNKLRRNESFMLQFPSRQGVGTHSLWLSAGVPLVFHFYGSRPPGLDRELIGQMMHAANSTDGLTLDA